ncbi:MAG TPA: hypothetical protein PK530_22495, partial [Anaerolineales bacterium]|nr:hypothetical protein [Anaerolineales bacterium]
MGTANTSSKSTKRTERRQRRQQTQLTTRLGWGAGLFVVLALIIYLIWSANRPLLGEKFETTGANDHVAENQPLPP